MTLRYRGAEYQPHTSQIQTVKEVIGHYRGATASRHVAKNVCQSHVDGMVYRGAKVR